MNGVLFVALGGAVGAVLRFLISALPMPLFRGEFPVWTLLINFAGAFVIGIVAGSGVLSKNAELFLKTGFCGGFTTFSTFSLETFKLFQSGRALYGGIYVVLSVGLCLLGVILGQMLSSRIFAK